MPSKISSVGGMPKMNAAFMGWEVPLELVRIVTAINSETGYEENTETKYKVIGAVQPLSAEELQLKPEAQRSFRWLQIHVRNQNGQQIEVGDELTYNGNTYRVKGMLDYSLNNYTEYHAMQVVTDTEGT